MGSGGASAARMGVTQGQRQCEDGGRFQRDMMGIGDGPDSVARLFGRDRELQTEGWRGEGGGPLTDL